MNNLIIIEIIGAGEFAKFVVKAQEN